MSNNENTEADLSKPQGSKFHSQWIKIKQNQENKGKEAEGGGDLSKFKTKKNMKGKETLSDKISGANISTWNDHRWLPASFFENYKSKYVLNEKIQDTYGKNAQLPSDISKEVVDYFEYDTKFAKLDANTRERIKEYGMEVQESYLKEGINNDEVIKRRERDGPNKLPEKKKTHWTIVLLKEWSSLFAILLWIAAALALVGYLLAREDTSNLYLCIVLVIVVLVTGLFSFWQNNKSDSIVEIFKGFSNSKNFVIREGKTVPISGIDLVVGDVVILKSGEKVPADLRIFESNDLSVNNSGLTGESDLVKLGPDPTDKGVDDPLEAKNIAFFSCLVTSGTGKGVVIKIGKETFMGRIADLASSAEGVVLGLESEMNRFIKIISVIAVTFGLAFFAGGFGRNNPVITNFVFALGIIVANVPEGLLSCLTVTLALTAQTLFEKNVMVKNLKSVETLGSITCICSDKTGTLTQNRMTVVHLWYDFGIYRIDKEQEDIYIDEKQIKMNDIDTNSSSFNIFKFAAICGSASNFIQETPEDYVDLVKDRNIWQAKNKKAPSDQVSKYVNELKAKYQEDYDAFYASNIEERNTDGDASEAGIIKFFESLESISEVRNQYPQVMSDGLEIKVPFNSKDKVAGFLRQAKNDPKSNYWLAFKGAPEYILKRCNRYLLDGKEIPMNDAFITHFKEANQAFALKGERVIAIAYSKLSNKDYPNNFEFKNDTTENPTPLTDKKPNYPTENLCFVGLVAMEDPPRVGVKDAIQKCKTAGIKVIMVTGDQTLTAASIAYQIGIIESLDDTPEVIMSKDKTIKTIEEAEAKSNTIIIDGNRLKKMMNQDEILSDDNPNKGAYLRNWLMKKDVVFARTSPDQKLVIVDGCQKLSHVVAVTGDGVNDSPAIKKADIGIAMGKVGTDVAKDAADIVLMDDNFANIVRGIKQGRLIFDSLKKIISYNLSSNIPELTPVIAFFIFAFPLPLTTILVLCIDILSDVYPNIAFAYERPEASLMNRQPRNSRVDKLCTLRLFGWSYLFMGMIEMTAGFLTFFVVLSDYGFTPKGLINITTEIGMVPAPGDVFNSADPYKGNSNAFIFDNSDRLGIVGEQREKLEEDYRRIDYISEKDALIDFRVMLWHMPEDTWDTCRYDGVAIKGEGKVCYSLEAVRHAQGAYLMNVIITQVANGLCYRTIQTSIFEHIFDNHNLNLAYILENVFIIMILYIPGLNVAFGVRPLVFNHFLPCLGVFIIMIAYSEFNKWLIRTVKEPDGSPGFFHRKFHI